MRRSSASSSNRFSVGDGREAVGADRHRHAGGVEVRQARQSGADPLVAARTGDDDRAGVAQPLERRRRSDARRGRPAGPAAGSRARRDTRPDRTPAAATRRSRRRAPRASRGTVRGRCAGTRSPRRLAEVDRQRRAAALRARSRANSAGDTEYGACATTDNATARVVVGRRREPAVAHASTRRHASRTMRGRIGDVESEQLVKHDAAEAGAREAARGVDQRVRDVADEHGAGRRASIAAALARGGRFGVGAARTRRSRAAR